MLLLLVVASLASSTSASSTSPWPNALRGTPSRWIESTSTTLSPVAEHGPLRVEGNKIINQHGRPVRLRGMSLFWSQWMGKFWSRATVHWLRSDWRVTVLRASMGVENDGYLRYASMERAKLIAVIDAAIEVGIYVIIDWHDHNAQNHLQQAKTFFAEMAQRYGRFPNVLFEPYNEPVPGLSWSTTIKPYHAEIVAEVRKHTDNIVILGCPEWSQHVDVAAQDPLPGANIAYAVHFYAAAIAHNVPIQDRVMAALAHGVPIFATEWGVCHYTGRGALGKNDAKAWLDFMATHFISDTNWAVSDKLETCSVLRPGTSGGGGWSEASLTEAGIFMRSSLRRDGESSCSAIGEDCRATTCCSEVGMRCYEKDATWGECKASCSGNESWSCQDLGRKAVVQEPPRSQCSAPGADCRESRCCTEVSMKCYEKNIWWASCRASCTGGVDPNDAPGVRTPWTCVLLDKHATTPAPTTPARTPVPTLVPTLAPTTPAPTTPTLATTPAPTPVPTLAPSPAPTLVPRPDPTRAPVCSADGHDCRGTKCCNNPDMRCFGKNLHWAECKSRCTPGVDMNDAPEWRTPWSCNPLDGNTSTPMPAPSTCSANGHDCRATQCCTDPGRSCFEKDQYWGECKATCVPGLDVNDAPEWRTPWSCKRLGNNESVCSADGHDCRTTRCCTNPNMKCFGKDPNWAECKTTCIPGLDMNDAIKWRTPWSCNRLDLDASTSMPVPVPTTCSSDGHDCRATKCCTDPGKICFEKDQHWGECKANCVSGVDLNDAPQWRTPWSCKRLGGNASALPR